MPITIEIPHVNPDDLAKVAMVVVVYEDPFGKLRAALHYTGYRSGIHILPVLEEIKRACRNAEKGFFAGAIVANVSDENH